MQNKRIRRGGTITRREFVGGALAAAGVLRGAPAFAEFGKRFFIIPNPMYGSWER